MNKITDNAAMVAAIEQAGLIATRASGETSALVEHPTRNAEGERLTVCMSHCTAARQCLTNFNADGQQTEAHTVVYLWKKSKSK